jgi:hypothetical protein
MSKLLKLSIPENLHNFENTENFGNFQTSYKLPKSIQIYVSINKNTQSLGHHSIWNGMRNKNQKLTDGLVQTKQKSEIYFQYTFQKYHQKSEIYTYTISCLNIARKA